MNEEQFNRIRQELEDCPTRSYVRPSDILMLSRKVRVVLNHAFRNGKISLTELANSFGLECDKTETIAEILVRKGILHKSEQEYGVYTARFGGVKTRPSESPLDKL